MEKNNKTAEEILQKHYVTDKGLVNNPGYIYEAMEEYASIQSSDKDERIKELEADKNRLDWIQSIMYDDRNYCEVYLSGLRDFRSGHAQAYQIESNPWQKFMSLQAPNLREAIDKAIQKTSEALNPQSNG